jgi:hypothetical protein
MGNPSDLFPYELQVSFKHILTNLADFVVTPAVDITPGCWLDDGRVSESG